MGFTKEQLEAINKEGTNIIVSAGAGSGKTAVLTERVIRKLKNGVDVDHLLVLTFTNEAAGEMKSRIRAAIIENNLQEQLSLLDSSYITTFDSYAYQIVKKYHYLLNINPNVSIIDSNIITIYKHKLIDSIFEKKYQERESKFCTFINDFCLKDDKSIKEYIIKLSNSLDLLLDKDIYLKKYLASFFGKDSLDKLIIEYQGVIEKKINELLEIYNDFSVYITDNLKYKLDDYFKYLFDGKCYLDYVLFKNLKAPRFVGVDELGIPLKDELKEKIEEIITLLRYQDEDEIRTSILKTKDYIQVIIEIINELDLAVENYKKIHDTYEFNDIAHLAIKVVKNNPDIAKELQEYFNEIMVDEYQDTSQIQEEFISLISNHNVYMVGDIKQSIYRFRNANPYIFQEKYNKYSNNDNGIKIDLLKNFRSRSETLFNINEIFNLIMDDEIGNAEYQLSHNMVYGNTAYDIEDTKANNYLEIYNYNKMENLEYKDYEKEIFIIAEDINEKIANHYKVFDKGTKKLRNITYSDICIITDRNKYLDIYKKILEYKNIPTVLFKDEELTNDDDILVIKNLISLVEHVCNRKFNNQFKYLFTSVARSFIFSYTDNLIYDIHSQNKFKEDQIVKLCQEIDIYKPLNEVINDILEKFNIYEKLTTLTNIEASIIRINNLLDIANSLNCLEYNISSFIEYLNDIIENGLTVKYSINTKGKDAVKIMNIHKSKGLEFSLCYFTGMQNKFTTKDISEKILFNEKYGFIIPYFNEELQNTILKDLYVNKFYNEEISEKIRLFYVALTRCREKMIIVTSLDENRTGYNTLVPNNKRLKYRSFLDILNSVSIISKYVIAKEANYTHEYEHIKSISFSLENNNNKMEKRVNQINYQLLEHKHFSKTNLKLLTKDELKKMSYGKMIHEILEYTDFYNPNNQYAKKLLKKIPPGFINVYKEYEFVYKDDNNEYHGVIDLLLEYTDHLKIIDYKLKNIDDKNYFKQVAGYKRYIENITNKSCQIYLYSILENDLIEIVEQ